MAQLLGVDVSQHNKGKWETIYNNEDISFVIIKATEGKTYQDPELENNIKIAISHGSVIGFYHYCRPDNENSPESEIINFYDTVTKYVEKYHIMEYLIALDYEDKSIGHEYWLFRAAAECYAKFNVPPLIYTNSYGVTMISKLSEWQNNPLNCGLWLATRYKTTPAKSNGIWRNLIAFWQYKVDMNLNLDMNIFFGGINQLLKYCVIQKDISDDFPDENPCEGCDRRCPHCDKR